MKYVSHRYEQKMFHSDGFFGLTRFVLHYNISVFFFFVIGGQSVFIVIGGQSVFIVIGGQSVFFVIGRQRSFCYRRTKFLFVIGGQSLLSHTAEMLFQHLLDNAVSVFEELPDLGVGGLGEVNPAVIPEKPFETDRHGICQFCSIEIQLLVH